MFALKKFLLNQLFQIYRTHKCLLFSQRQLYENAHHASFGMWKWLAVFISPNNKLTLCAAVTTWLESLKEHCSLLLQLVGLNCETSKKQTVNAITRCLYFKVLTQSLNMHILCHPAVVPCTCKIHVVDSVVDCILNQILM